MPTLRPPRTHTRTPHQYPHTRTHQKAMAELRDLAGIFRQLGVAAHNVPMAQLRGLAGVLRQLLGMGARNVPQALAIVGVATWATVAAGRVVSPSSATLVPAVIGGGATIFAAVWVGDDLPRRRTMGQFFLSLAFAPLVLAAVVTGHYEYLVLVLAILFPAERGE